MIEIGRVSEDHSHNALVIGESPLGIATAEEPLRQGARTLGSREGQIYSDMLQYRRFPSNLLVGSEERLRALHAAIGAQ